jgi:carboxypeptidase C (cathepsin A)
MFSSTVVIACLLAFFASQTTFAQFVPTPTNFTHKTGYAGVSVRYKQVPPGICELNPKVKSFTGYADVGENQHIFFWFFEARNQDPTTAPLTVWINGGPGSSSMIGLWQELGPCGVDSNGKVYNNPYSWSNASNMIFIDQPVQVGFSYSEAIPGYIDPSSNQLVQLPSAECPDYAAGSCATYSYPNYTLTASSTDAAAPNFWKTLQGFMGAFPQYSREEFLFTTESYGGHYGPIFNEYIETQNAKNISGALKIKLGAVLIGNGWYDPIIQASCPLPEQPVLLPCPSKPGIPSQQQH